MMNKKLEKKCLKRSIKLKKKAAKRISFLEKSVQRFNGKKDGLQSLPNAAGTSPNSTTYLNIGNQAYREQSMELVKLVQLLAEDELIRIQSLTQVIIQGESDLTKFQDRELIQPTVTRKEGEKSLTDDQIAQRRGAEFEESVIQPHQAKIQQLESKVAAAYEEKLSLVSLIVESVHSVQLVERQMHSRTEHLHQFYWRALLMRHEKASELPVLPAEVPSSDAFEIIVSLHEDLSKELASSKQRYAQLLMKGESDAS